MQELENLARITSLFPKIPQSPELIVCLQIVVQIYLSVSMQRELSLYFYRNNVYEHLEQVSRTCVYFNFQLLRPDSSNLPYLYSTFHLEYPLVLSRFCFQFT